MVLVSQHGDIINMGGVRKIVTVAGGLTQTKGKARLEVVYLTIGANDGSVTDCPDNYDALTDWLPPESVEIIRKGVLQQIKEGYRLVQMRGPREER